MSTIKFLGVVEGSVMEGPHGPETLELEIEVEEDGERKVWPFHYVPSDPAPATLAIKAWLDEHPDVAIKARPPVATTALRLGRRPVREMLVGLGLPADAVEIALDALPEGAEKEAMRLDWMEGQGFYFEDPLVTQTLHYWMAERTDLNTGRLETAWRAKADA